jgi:hypothetical protein
MEAYPNAGSAGIAGAPVRVPHCMAADEAFRWLEKAVEIGESGLFGLGTEPLLASLHDDPRWASLLERTGFSPAKLSAIEFEVPLPTP